MIIFLVVLEEVEETEGKKNGRNNGVVFEMSGVGKGRRRRRAVIVKWKVRENWVWRGEIWWVPSTATSSASAAATTNGRDVGN